ncbi:hypothetical protein AAG906_035867 [Vitis piasezkii]
MADYDGNYVIDYEGIEAGMRCCGRLHAAKGIKSDGVVREEDDGKVRLGGYAKFMVKDLGMALAGMESDRSWTIFFHGWRVPRPDLNGYRDEEDEENDDDVVNSKVGSVGSGFWNAPAALVGMESDRSWTISFHGRRVPRLNLNRSWQRKYTLGLRMLAVPLVWFHMWSYSNESSEITSKKKDENNGDAQ